MCSEAPPAKAEPKEEIGKPDDGPKAAVLGSEPLVEAKSELADEEHRKC